MQNFKFKCGVFYFKRVKKGEGEEIGWKICFRTENEKDAFSSHVMLRLKSIIYSVR